MKPLWQRLGWWLAGALLVGLALSRAVWWTTDYLWYASLGQGRVYTTLLATRLALFVGGAVIAWLLLGAGFLVSRRLDARPKWASESPGELTWNVALWAGLPALLVLFAVAAGWWATRLQGPLLLYLHHQPGGAVDPVFGRDLGFWLERLPFLLSVQRPLFLLALASWVGLYLRYVDLPSVTEEMQLAPTRSLSDAARRHLCAHGTLVFAIWAWGFLLARPALLITARSSVLHGAGWTDTYVRLPALLVLAAAALLAALGCLLAARRGNLRLLGIVVGGFVLLQVLAAVVPAMVQRLSVLPSESEREAPYIARCIEATRAGLGLAAVERRAYDATGRLNAVSLAVDQEVVSTVPLWSPVEISEQIVGTESLRGYYNFGLADYDRYRLGGRREQVALMVRELQTDRLDRNARTWVNRHLVFTHGYGLVMASAHAIGPAGKPVKLVRDIPPAAPAGLPLRQPAVYYGELPSEYILTGLRPEARTRELDYPSGDQNVTTSYAGSGGVPLGGLVRRVAFAWRLRSFSLLVSDLLHRESRVHFRRDLMTRLQALAPFLAFDSDPYPAVVGGRVVWIADAYTVSATYPYSRPHPLFPAAALATPQPDSLKQADASYLRNSVKAVVDAYDGTVRLYLVDPGCPLAAAWSRAFPTLFTSDPAPPELAAHFRYPGDLFCLQARAYSRFHMTDPSVFYNAEDLWDIAREETTSRTARPDGTYQFESSRERMVPYYVLLRLPGESEARFRLIVPFVPAGAGEGTTGRDNMIGWMAADCDPEGYGQLTVFHFPKGRLIWGPLQVEAQIDQDPDISQQLTLWGEQGSRVLRGRLLVVPLAGTLLYIEPLFITADRRGALPELKRVIVFHHGTVRMAETLDEALEAVLSGARSGTGAAELLQLRQRAAAAQRAFEQAEQRRRAGDLTGYGAALEEAERLVRELAAGR